MADDPIRAVAPAAALTATDQARMVAALRQTVAAPPSAPPVALLETHLSWVLLAGALAYKVKKAVNLGFADFSTLARRRWPAATG